MKELHSFREVIENDYFEKLYIALSGFISKNINRLDLHSNRIKKAAKTELRDMNIKYLDISDTPGDIIDFQITVRAGIRIFETVNRIHDFDKIYKWFCISCSGYLNNGLHNLMIESINEYSPNPTFGKKGEIPCKQGILRFCWVTMI